MGTVPDPRYVTLSSSGAGSITFRGQKPGLTKRIHKITVEPAATGSGICSIYAHEQLVTSKALALLMAAEGVIDLECGQEARVTIVGGPINTQVKITAHYEELRT